MAIPGNTEGIYEPDSTTSIDSIDAATLSQGDEQLAQGVVQDAQKLEQETITSVLEQILDQLKMLNLHWQEASGNKFTEEDIEE